MTIDIYPAVVAGNNVNHADDWNEGSTLNVANANFWSLIHELQLDGVVKDVPGQIKLKTLELALSTAHSPRYSARLKQICAVAHIKKATHIAFA